MDLPDRASCVLRRATEVGLSACNTWLPGPPPYPCTSLFLVYPQGNFIEAITDTNYFQIDETKYGKPMIDLLGYETAALRVTLWRRYTESDPYFAQISGFWSTGLLRVFAEVPDVSWS